MLTGGDTASILYPHVQATDNSEIAEYSGVILRPEHVKYEPKASR